MSALALITGGHSGIGFAAAQALAAQGWKLALASELSADSKDVQAALERLGPGARYYCHDLRQLERIPDLLAAIAAQQGAITALVSNAGIASPVRGDLLELEPQHYELVLEVNLKGAFFLAQQVARTMLTAPATSYRSLVFVSSVSAELASVERGDYCISKAGASMMAKLFALRLAEAGIGVFELRPGIIRTAMTAGVSAKYDPLIAGGLVPARRWGQPEDIATALVPLLSGQLHFATGSVLNLDGGLAIPRLGKL